MSAIDAKAFDIQLSANFPSWTSPVRFRSPAFFVFNSLPPFTGAQIEKVPFAAIRAYVEGLSFNPDTPWADVKPVDWAGDKIGGRDTSRIQPVVGAFHFDPAELAQGRIVARVSSTKVYPRTGFGRWWSYWWIDRNGVDRKTGKRGQWRSLFISDPRHTKAKKTWFERDFHVDSAYHDRCSGGSTCARLRPGTVTAVSFIAKPLFLGERGCGQTTSATGRCLADQGSLLRRRRARPRPLRRLHATC